MLLGVTEIVSGLPFAVPFAGVGAASLLTSGRRRVALNEALHELRRPLQALALALPPDAAVAPAVDSSLLLAVAAIDRLEREINGHRGSAEPAEVPLRELVDAAAARWAARAERSEAWLRSEWIGREATVLGDAVQLAQALDNLIINGIEHGRGDLTIRGGRRGRFVRIAVRDQGGRGRPARRRTFARVPLRFRRGKGGRHGHGLRVVRRTAAEHGGRFELVRSDSGTEAVLELPASGLPGERQ